MIWKVSTSSVHLLITSLISMTWWWFVKGKDRAGSPLRLPNEAKHLLYSQTTVDPVTLEDFVLLMLLLTFRKYFGCASMSIIRLSINVQEELSSLNLLRDIRTLCGRSIRILEPFQRKCDFPIGNCWPIYLDGSCRIYQRNYLNRKFYL